MAVVSASSRKRRQPRTAAEVLRCVVESAFPIRQYLCVPNVSWGMLPWEADLLALSKAGYLSEVEIKVSLSDLKRDADKRKWDFDNMGFIDSPQSLLRAMWFAMPLELAARDDVTGLVPGFAGILGCEIRTRVYTSKTVRYWATEKIRKPKINPKAPKQDDQARLQMARLGTMRYWSLMRKHTTEGTHGA